MQFGGCNPGLAGCCVTGSWSCMSKRPADLWRFRTAAASVCAVVLSSSSGCGIIRERPESKPSELDIVGKPMPPDKAKEVLSEIGQNFAYGPGLGDAALNIGTAVVFPPYAIYLLGNALLSVSGYEPVTVASLLPEEQGKTWSRTYDSVVSGPGKVVAAVAGREYRSRDVAEEKMRTVLESISDQATNSDTTTQLVSVNKKP